MENKEICVLEKLRNKKKYAQYIFLENDLQKQNLSTTMKVAFLRNYTVEMLIPVIKGELALLDVSMETYLGDYDNIQQDILNINSPLYFFKPDVICVSVFLESLAPDIWNRFNSLSYEKLLLEKKRIIEYIELIFLTLRKNTSATILWHNFIYPNIPILGILDIQVENSQIEFIRDLNQKICQIAHSYLGIYIVDIATIFYKIGYDNAFDKKSWVMSKNPYTREALVKIGIEYGKFFNVLLGKIKKCIILDCDNTLWGGIVGEDGTYGIKVSAEYPGICYQNLQKEILNLYDRGIIIALCSKNNEKDVWDVFLKNNGMILKKDHIASFRINWKEKPSNIKEIACELNIGTDSIIFVDDSQFECDFVKKVLPEVMVIHLKDEPSGFADLLRSCGQFNALTFTEDDQKRSLNYQAERKRNELKNSFTTINDYLKSLSMTATLKINNREDIQRVAQLTQKTNQFNLTAKRYSESVIENFMNSSSYDVISIQLKDVISDLGVVGLAIVHYIDDVAELDTFLLSCRALGRNVEDVLFKKCLGEIKKNKTVKFVCGCYNKSQKNEQVVNFFERYNLKKIKEDLNGNAIWKNKVSLIKVDEPNYIRIEKKGK